MSQEKLEDCLSVIVSLSEVLRDRHTDIQNDSVFFSKHPMVFLVLLNSIQTITDPKNHIFRDDYIKK